MLLWAVPAAVLACSSIPILVSVRAVAAEAAALRSELAALSSVAGDVAGLRGDLERLGAGARRALRSRPGGPPDP